VGSVPVIEGGGVVAVPARTVPGVAAVDVGALSTF
jgi:hypothetical protein